MSNKGASLMEIILYVGILSALSTFLIYSVVGLVRSYKTIQLRNDVSDNATAVLSLISEEVRSARTIYEPTSIFNQGQGQLSLWTLRSVPDGENWTYVDFYLDNQKVYLKREGVDPFPITSDRVLVSQLKFSRIGTGTTTPSVIIDLIAGPNLAAANPFYFIKSFSATAGLR